MTVWIHLPVTHPGADDLPRLAALQSDLLQALHNLGSFGGDFAGGGEAVLEFHVKSVKRALETARMVLSTHGMLEGSDATIIDDACEVIGRVDLCEYPLQLPRADRRARRKARIGDYYGIPLASGLWRHACYLTKMGGMGDLLRVLDVARRDRPASLEELLEAPELYPPLFVSVAGCVVQGKWRLVGNKPRSDAGPFVFRGSTAADESGRTPGLYKDWCLVVVHPERQLEFTQVGELQESQRAFEVYRVWLVDEALRRIETGINPDAQLR